MSTSTALIPSGIPGLDDVLQGGLRPGHLYFVEGDPGTGKTTFGLQFLIEGLRQGERCLLISLAESPQEVALIAHAHGWSIEGLEVRDLVSSDEVHSTALFDLSEIALDDRMQAMLAEMDSLRPQRLVLDTLAGLRVYSDQSSYFRRHIELFRSKAVEIGTTLLVTDEASGPAELHPRSLAWGIIRMEHRVTDYGRGRRRLWLPKLRGQAYIGGYHDMRIETGGLTVFPRLETREPSTQPPDGRVSSGSAPLDALLGGGVERGTSVGIVGAPGCGKSTLVSSFAVAAVGRGERVALYAFDESLITFRKRALSQALDIDAALASDLLRLRQIDPGQVAPGELARELADEVEHNHTQLIVIDSLNGYLQAMPDDPSINLQVHDLLSYLSAHGALTLVTLAHPSPLSRQEGLAVDLSYLADTVIAQRYFEAYGAIRYAISVMKKRYGDHERTIREYRIGRGGIIVGEPLSEFRGVLTGVPEYLGENKPLL
ncbi:ATPase domain-containing protein [Lamprobacter modestohalophilus]|uniref:ATPase domain-containing protein n=1 Tax=Lamprobacter modestohalophilus TaxID=1064514 RepID=UPI002ADEB0C8|nr:ATPase domain-containing protein [Lamprobacter modestohalophilus]MEA1053181.1 ATPase domain-containing protein [Lamprobacter modestohalophilus]